MTTDPSVSDQTYQYFLQEAAELLQTMDDELQNLKADFSVQKVHNLMRAAHTLKGASASVGLDAIKKTTHSLEDVFKALCHQDTVLSVETEGLIFQGYDCLKLLMSAQLAGAQVDEADILDRMAAVVTRLQEILGDRFGQGGHLPTSSELGFDMTQSIFEVGVAQRIAALAEALEHPDPEELVDLLRTQVEVFIGLAESLDLPGFGEIAQVTQSALEQNPDKVLEIAPVALENYRAAQTAVLAGDRVRGGDPSAALKKFCDRPSRLSPQKTSQRRSGSLQKISAKKAKSQSTQAGLIGQLWRLLIHPIGAPATPDRRARSLASSAGKSKSAAMPLSQGSSSSPAPIDSIEYATEGDQFTDLSSVDLSGLLNGDENSIESGLDLAELPLDTAELAVQPSLEEQPTTVPLRAQNSGATIRITVEHLDQLSQAMGELLTHQNRQALYNEQMTALAKKMLSRIAQQQEQLSQYRGQSLAGDPSRTESNSSSAARFSSPAYAHFDAIELDQYSDAQLLAQSFLEETVQQSESAEAIDLFIRRSGQTLEKQKRLLSNTRETLLEARMLPLEKVFQRFPSMLARLKAEHHKQADLVLIGEEVLVDKVIADKLYDPLLHLVRNAFDHGLEPAETRLAQNKSATGKITIEAIQQGRHLVINVRDDGQGLDLEMIRRKAVENQLITLAEAATLTPPQTIDLLFEAGFSTASEVDDLSGRGVGLDAVRAQVRSLQGWVTVSYEPGAGTCFTLQIPSSLTIAKLLLCQAQGRIYALIADAIKHILMPSAAQMRVWKGGKTLTWQADGEEHLVPVNPLAEVLHYASPMPNHHLSGVRSDVQSAVSNPVILLQHQDALVGLEVDHLLGEQELVISSLGKTIVPPAYLYGSSILPDGQLTLVLDGAILAGMILDRRNRGRIDISVGESGATRLILDAADPGLTKKLILTVDDSLTVRNALSEALQKADYQVIQARDGAEALQQLQRYSNVQAILCDIEMPGMNGFEFLKARQQMPAVAAIPTIMLTSRAGNKHRLLTEELGATTYLTKPYLTPQLLETLAEVIERQPSQQLSAVGETHE